MGISKYFLEEFQKLYTSSIPQYPESLEDIAQSCISELENKELMAMPTEEEICRSVWELHPLKSPGPDGFSGVFFRTY